MTRFRFDFEWRTTALTAVLFPVLVALGFWQLERADEKAALAIQQERRAAAEAVSPDQLVDLPAEAIAYRRVRLAGVFLQAPTIFVDNQVRDGRYGHDVVSLFDDALSGRIIMLNRGWIPGDPARQGLPAVDTPDETLELNGQVYVPPGEPYLLEPEVFETLGAEVLVQQSNSRGLRQALEPGLTAPLFPWEVRLAPDQDGGFRRDWPVVNVSPSKHRGYALQWFTMAAVLLLLFVFRSTNLASVLGFGKRSEAS